MISLAPSDHAFHDPFRLGAFGNVLRLDDFDLGEILFHGLYSVIVGLIVTGIGDRTHVEYPDNQFRRRRSGAIAATARQNTTRKTSRPIFISTTSSHTGTAFSGPGLGQPRLVLPSLTPFPNPPTVHSVPVKTCPSPAGAAYFRTPPQTSRTPRLRR